MSISFSNRLLVISGLTLLSFAALGGEAEPSAIDQRIALEWETYDNPFAITPHRPTYILPLTYNDSPNNTPYAGLPLEVENSEIKMQFSFKVPLLEKVLFGQGLLSFGYTQLSLWQAYNSGYSSPFRETNYEPEMLLTFPSEYRFGKFRGRLITLGLNHQSNGRAEPLSRSWNRVMLDFVLERDGSYLSFKPWWRIPESGDDNPDIEEYLGNFELRGLRKFSDHTVGVMVRNNLRSDNKGAVQLDYTYRLNRRLWGYVQLFNGHGESLIDYNHYNRSIGIGVMLANWL
ncbi:MAG: phospholipase A [Gammaproteobacteria bacterium]|nr:phospholipase A [Gammaproteobacteria bacterium]